MGHLIRAVPVALALAWSGAVVAHDNTAPEHGGQVRMAGDYRLELVVLEDGVRLYVEDEFDELTTANAAASLTIETGGQRTSIALAPAGADRYETHGLSIPTGTKLSVQLTLEPSRARVNAAFHHHEVRTQ